MNLIENPDPETIDWTRVVALYNSVNWENRLEKEVKRAFQKSTALFAI